MGPVAPAVIGRAGTVVVARTVSIVGPVYGGADEGSTANPPMMPAAIAPPRASAGCGVAMAARPSVAAAARAVRVLVVLVMTHVPLVHRDRYPINDPVIRILRTFAQRQLCF